MHVPLVGGIVLAADAAGDLLNRELIYSVETVGESVESFALTFEEEPSLRALSFFFTGGICVALLCIAVIGLLDECEDEPDIFVLPKLWRIIWRVPVAVIIVCLSIPNLDLTLLFGLMALILVVLWVFETIVSVPRRKRRS
ncbi:CIC11C00000005387 [Sungouiella intermedia]|uniref:CIC11C00000005387 n=1 Tax=Sungouiella intermedia TaxID=45354 RepID=A0A1L0BQ58_9ASCO|nr:CIC11C00000005387 [[Candida] intermedia]